MRQLDGASPGRALKGDDVDEGPEKHAELHHEQTLAPLVVKRMPATRH
jgi:hypothetical protein